MDQDHDRYADARAHALAALYLHREMARDREARKVWRIVLHALGLGMVTR